MRAERTDIREELDRVSRMVREQDVAGRLIEGVDTYVAPLMTLFGIGEAFSEVYNKFRMGDITGIVVPIIFAEVLSEFLAENLARNISNRVNHTPFWQIRRIIQIAGGAVVSGVLLNAAYEGFMEGQVFTPVSQTLVGMVSALFAAKLLRQMVNR